MSKSRRKLPVIAGIAFIVAFVAYMAWSTFGNSQQSAEVCVTYNGRTNCGSAAAATREQAERTATDLACNDLGHGMTELMQCQNAPRKVTWKQ
jgi:hypothetical protein